MDVDREKQDSTYNNTSDMAVDRDYTVVEGLGRQQSIACMVYDWLGRQQRY